MSYSIFWSFFTAHVYHKLRPTTNTNPSDHVLAAVSTPAIVQNNPVANGTQLVAPSPRRAPFAMFNARARRFTARMHPITANHSRPNRPAFPPLVNTGTTNNPVGTNDGRFAPNLTIARVGPYSSSLSNAELLEQGQLQPEPPNNFCKAKEKIGNWLIKLSEQGLWPLSVTMGRTSIEEIHRKLKKFEEEPGNHWIGFSPNSCKCKICITSVNKAMRDLDIESMDDVKPLCLICVKNGKFVPDDGNCTGEEHRGALCVPQKFLYGIMDARSARRRTPRT